MTALPFAKPSKKESLSVLASKARAGDKTAAQRFFQIKAERAKARRHRFKRPDGKASSSMVVKYAKHQAKKLCEVLWPAYIKKRDGYKCKCKGHDTVHCSGKKKSDMQAAHIVTRGVKGTKFHPDNGKCLCSGHHVYYTNNPGAWEKLCNRLWPEVWNAMWSSKWQTSKPDFIGWAKELKERLEAL